MNSLRPFTLQVSKKYNQRRRSAGENKRHQLARWSIFSSYKVKTSSQFKNLWLADLQDDCLVSLRHFNIYLQDRSSNKRGVVAV
ncbi:unnamed protein product [Schistosoma haematobium]|nr:unnamed protein product [Schistosoma haematobium]